MEPTVLFRDFEERDIDFIYRCKNDEKLNKLIVGQYHPFTYTEAEKWVHGCMGEHETYKFWAICTNDEEKKIIGWTSLSSIDYENKSVCAHGIVIGDKDYNDGFAWLEGYLYSLYYSFEVLKFNRYYCSHLLEHKQSIFAEKLFFFKREGVQREAVYKNGKYHDIALSSILSREYFFHKENGDYKINSLIKRTAKLRKI